MRFPADRDQQVAQYDAVGACWESRCLGGTNVIATTPWYTRLSEPLERVFDQVVAYAPNILGALAILLIGWVFARVLRFVSRRLATYGLKRLARVRWVEGESRYEKLPVVMGRFIFWIVMLFFIAAAIEALGLEKVSDLFGGATTYLPRVLLATLIVFAGILLGDLARRWTLRAARGAGIPLAESLGRAAQVVLIAVAVLIALDQLGIESRVLILALAIAAGSTFGATALAFGLGAGPTVSNIIAAHYVRRSYSVGSTVRIGELKGPIMEISRTAVILEAPEGRVMVPARRFAEEVSVLIRPGA